MSYVITHRRECTCEPSVCESDDEMYHETHCAVVRVARSDSVLSVLAVETLSQARAEIAARVYQYAEQTRREARESPSESGGSVRLPDGGEIVVEPCSGEDFKKHFRMATG